MAYFEHCESDMCPPVSSPTRHEVSCGCGCSRCCSMAPSVVASRLAAAEARAEKAEGEVKYLRAHREWAAAAGQAASRLGSIVIPDWWLAANPEPQPPEGVTP